MKHEQIVYYFKKEKLSLFNYARNLTKHSEDAEDLIQDAFLKLLCSNNSFDLRSVKPLVLTTIKNLFIDELRKKHSQKRRHINCEIEEIANLPDEEKFINIDTYINKLKPKKKNALILYKEGYKHDEIADILGYSRNSIKPLIQRAKADLKQTFLSMES